jgi:hypothetical protein
MSNLKTLALIAIPVLVVAALLGGVAAGALNEREDTLTTVIPATETVPAPQAGATTDGTATTSVKDAADAGVVDRDDRPLRPAELDRVSRAALTIAGGGTVSDVDRSDDLGEAYEVEVQTDAGEVDIALDGGLARVPNLRYDD